jgi:hypothetical protein
MRLLHDPFQKQPTSYSDEAKIVTTATGAGLLPMCQTMIDTNYQALSISTQAICCSRLADKARIRIPVYCLVMQG